MPQRTRPVTQKDRAEEEAPFISQRTNKQQMLELLPTAPWGCLHPMPRVPLLHPWGHSDYPEWFLLRTESWNCLSWKGPLKAVWSHSPAVNRGSHSSITCSELHPVWFCTLLWKSTPSLAVSAWWGGGWLSLSWDLHPGGTRFFLINTLEHFNRCCIEFTRGNKKNARSLSWSLEKIIYWTSTVHHVKEETSGSYYVS